MWKAVAAVLHHSINDPDSEKHHSFSPGRPDSWCKHQEDKITGEETYKQKTNIDSAVSKLIAPVFSYNNLGLFCLNACAVKLKMSTNPSTLYGHGVRKWCMLDIALSRLLLSLL